MTNIFTHYWICYLYICFSWLQIVKRTQIKRNPKKLHPVQNIVNQPSYYRYYPFLMLVIQIMLNLGNTGLNISTLVSSLSGHVIHVNYSKIILHQTILIGQHYSNLTRCITYQKFGIVITIHINHIKFH